MISYMLKVTCCWLIFYAFYFCFLKKETFFKHNRWYLLSTLIISTWLPMAGISRWSIFNNPSFTSFLQPITETGKNYEVFLETIVVQTRDQFWSMDHVLLCIYLAGLLFFTFRFAWGIFQIGALKKKGKLESKNHYTLVRTNKKHLPFSFFHYLFWSDQIDISFEDRQHILKHELVHIQQGHSFDVMVVAFLKIIYWWNPIIHFYDNALRNQHEYHADETVLKNTQQYNYSKLLLRQKQNLQFSLVNNFNQSQLKKRILMMMRTKSNQNVKLKYILALPLLLCLSFFFSQENFALEPTHMPSNNTITNDSIPDKNGVIVFEEVDVLPIFKGCNLPSSSVEEKKACSEQKLLQYIFSNIKYPQEARKKGVEGLVIVKFIIDKTGIVRDAEIVKSIGAGCDEESLRVVNNMPEWTPGEKDGKKVHVVYHLPIKYRVH